ncbi:MAG: cysteine hydrolase [Thermoleophilia bacterium]|nr:cysteine hydrolase [Thermoleophilia bacterium]
MKRAMVIADAINGFLKFGNLASPRMLRILPCVEEHLKHEIKAGSKIIFLHDNHEPDDPEFKMFPPHCIRGTDETLVVDELMPYTENATLIPKTKFDGFFGTTLEKELADFGPDEVILAGVCTDICVLHTTESLRNRDYRVIVPRFCVETYDAPGHDGDEVNRFALAHIRDVLGAEVSE